MSSRETIRGSCKITIQFNPGGESKLYCIKRSFKTLSRLSSPFLMRRQRDPLLHFRVLCKWERPAVLCQLRSSIRAPAATPCQCCSHVFVCLDQSLRVAGGAPDICCLTRRRALAPWTGKPPKGKANVIQGLTKHSPSERNPLRRWLSPQRQLERETEKERGGKKNDEFKKPHRAT